MFLLSRFEIIDTLKKYPEHLKTQVQFIFFPTILQLNYHPYHLITTGSEICQRLRESILIHA